MKYYMALLILVLFTISQANSVPFSSWNDLQNAASLKCITYNVSRPGFSLTLGNCKTMGSYGPFDLSAAGGNYYYIRTNGSGMDYWTVVNGRLVTKRSGRPNDTQSQWSFMKKDGVYFRIKSRSNSQCLTPNGDNITLAPCNYSDQNQLFKHTNYYRPTFMTSVPRISNNFLQQQRRIPKRPSAKRMVRNTPPKQAALSGFYQIKNGGLCLKNSKEGPPHVFTKCTETENTFYFKFRMNRNGTYVIRTKSKKRMTLKKGRVYFSKKRGGSSQKWRITQSGNTYTITNVKDNSCLNATNKLNAGRCKNNNDEKFEVIAYERILTA